MKGNETLNMATSATSKQFPRPLHSLAPHRLLTCDKLQVKTKASIFIFPFPHLQCVSSQEKLLEPVYVIVVPEYRKHPA